MGGSRSGSVSTAGSCLESEGLAKDALKANLKVLNTISKTELDTDTLKNIFGEGEFQSRSGQSCGFTDVISCGKDVTDAVMNAWMVDLVLMQLFLVQRDFWELEKTAWAVFAKSLVPSPEENSVVDLILKFFIFLIIFFLLYTM